MVDSSRYWPADYELGRDIIANLDGFLGKLPNGCPYGAEMRNRNCLKPQRFDCPARHQAAHVFNSWEAMPSVGEQMGLPGSRTNPNLVAARFLLKPGRKYEQAVKAFEPYDRSKDENPEARAAGRALVAEGQRRGRSAGRCVRQQQAGRECDFDNQEAPALAPRCFVQAAHRLRGSLRRRLGEEFERPIQHGLGFVQLAIADQRFGLLHDLSHGRGVASLLLPTTNASLHPVPL